MGKLIQMTPALVIAALYAFFLAHQTPLKPNSPAAHLEHTKTQVADLQAEKAQLEARVARLRADTLDLDYLEERVRAVLGYARAGEVVVPPGELAALLATERDDLHDDAPVDADRTPAYALANVD